jgi:glycosyltransferase involved in cell wall biosynthesis
MTHLPDISVIVCAHNHGKWLERCIRSLNHQQNITKDEFEIIVVDDASTDMTQDVLDNLGLIENLRVIENESNLGLPQSLNKAIKTALGRYIVRVDSDDYVMRLFLFLTRLFLDMNREYQAVAVDYVLVDEFENLIKKVNCFEEEIACGVMFRKECLFDIGLYDESFSMREGHELRKRFVNKFRLARLEFPLYKYRKHSENRTNNVDELCKYDNKLKGKK